ncbi:unnamed protein product [Ixodes persulcatus]
MLITNVFNFSASIQFLLNPKNQVPLKALRSHLRSNFARQTVQRTTDSGAGALASASVCTLAIAKKVAAWISATLSVAHQYPRAEIDRFRRWPNWHRVPQKIESGTINLRPFD